MKIVYAVCEPAPGRHRLRFAELQRRFRSLQRELVTRI
jgi:hypothetical protein